MNRTLTFAVTAEAEGLTLEQFLRLRGCSHHIMTHLKKTDNGILRNGIHAYTNQQLCAGDTVTIHLIETECSPNIKPVWMPLSIVLEDEDLMVLDKPCDMPIHPSIANYTNTLANAVMYYFQAQDIPFVFRCINRLDRDTSGLLIVAKNMLSASLLSNMSARRELHREYLTIVEGILPEQGRIDAPIARLEGSALMRCVDPLHGETAVTHYTRIGLYREPQSGRILSLAAVRLETGRTHQIRVHMKHIGHPMIGDFLYYPDSLALFPRQALHSHRLSFTHPLTGEELTFERPMPEDMQTFLSSCIKETL